MSKQIISKQLPLTSQQEKDKQIENEKKTDDILMKQVDREFNEKCHSELILMLGSIQLSIQELINHLKS